MVGQGSNGQSSGAPGLLVLIEGETTGGKETKFIVRRKDETLVGQGRVREIRIAIDHFSGVQLAKTEDHRTMIEGLMIVNVSGEETSIGHI